MSKATTTTTSTSASSLPKMELGEDQQIMIEVDLDRVNEYFTCNLCHGYFRDAHTIAECLHTFCKSCIVKHTYMVLECPTCRCKITVQNIRPDHTIQALFSKLYADVEKDEEEREKEWYKSNNIPMPERQVKVVANGRGGAGGRKQDAKRLRSEQQQPQDGSSASSMNSRPPIKVKIQILAEEPSRALQRPYIEASGAIRVDRMREYIAGKAGVAPERLVLFCNREQLPLEHTIEFIQKTKWTDPTLTMTWTFRVV